MKIAVVVSRILLGLVFFIFGLNAFLHFMPQPPIPGDAGLFASLLFIHHYITVVGLVEVVGGAFLLAGRFVPLGLTLLAPVVVNILLYHLFFSSMGLPIALIVVLIELFLIWAYRRSFAGLFEARPAV